MKTTRVLLIGQPNSGKSSLLNALAGAKVIVSNYPGTTVEIIQANTILEDIKVRIIDTPGIYSLSDSSFEETVTKEFIFERKYDLVVNIVDATSIERGFYLTLQLRELGVPMIVALNFVEDAQRKGIIVDVDKLSSALGVPLIPFNPITGVGLKDLAITISNAEEIQAYVKPLVIQYDDHIEEALKEVISRLPSKLNLYPRSVALRILEEDNALKVHLSEPLDEILPEEMKKYHPDPSEDIMLTRFGCASSFCKQYIDITSVKEVEEPISEKIDRILMNSRYGWIISFMMIMTLFYIMLLLGGILEDRSVGLAEAAINWVVNYYNLSGVAMGVLENALTGAATGIGIALAYVLIFYILLSLLEDTGLLSRIVLSFSRFMAKLDLPGNAVVPMLLNFGCTVPAISATRILKTRSERMITTATFVGIPCSSRTAIIMGLVASYAGVNYAIATYILAIAAGLVFSKIASLFIKVESSPFLLEIPPYRKPLLGNVAAKSWIRMQDFVKVVIPLLVLGGIVYSVIDYLGWVDSLVGPLKPIGMWLNLPARAVLPLIYGYLQKDLTISMLFTVLGTRDVTAHLSTGQIFIFGLQASIQFPCIIASSMAWREFGWRFAVALTLFGFIYGLLVSGVVSFLLSFILPSL